VETKNVHMTSEDSHP